MFYEINKIIIHHPNVSLFDVFTGTGLAKPRCFCVFLVLNQELTPQGVGVERKNIWELPRVFFGHVDRPAHHKSMTPLKA